MQNDVLKNNIAPWQEKGRWYHAHITESGIDSLNTDQFLLDNMTNPAGSGTFTFNAKCRVIDYIFHVKNHATASTRYYQKQFNFTGSGTMQISGINPSQYSTLDCDLYVYIVIR